MPLSSPSKGMSADGGSSSPRPIDGAGAAGDGGGGRAASASVAGWGGAGEQNRSSRGHAESLGPRPARSHTVSSGDVRSWGGTPPQQQLLQQQITAAPSVPSTSPGANFLWHSVGEKPQLNQMHGKALKRAERKKESAAALRDRQGSSSGGGGRAAVSKSPTNDVRSLSDSSPATGEENPGPSPSGPFAGEGGGTPPKLSLGKSPLGKSPLGRSPGSGVAAGSGTLPLAPPSASSSGDASRGGDVSRRHTGQGGRESPPGGGGGGGGGGGSGGGGGASGKTRAGGATTATATPPQTIQRSSSDGPNTVERRGGSKAPRRSSPRPVPGTTKAVAESSLERARGAGGKNIGRSQSGSAAQVAAAAAAAGSALEHQQQHQQQLGFHGTALRGDKLGVKLRRPARRPPLDHSYAFARSGDSGGIMDRSQSQATPTL